MPRLRVADKNGMNSNPILFYFIDNLSQNSRENQSNSSFVVH